MGQPLPDARPGSLQAPAPVPQGFAGLGALMAEAVAQEAAPQSAPVGVPVIAPEVTPPPPHAPGVDDFSALSRPRKATGHYRGILAVLGALAMYQFLYRELHQEVPQRPAQAQPAQAPSGPTAQAPTALAKAPALAPLAPPAPELTLRQPLAGRDRLLSLPEIRYCLATEIRLTTAAGAAVAAQTTSLEALNRAMADYNARCTSYRFAPADMQTARAEIEAQRSRIEALARTWDPAE